MIKLHYSLLFQYYKYKYSLFGLEFNQIVNPKTNSAKPNIIKALRDYFM